MHRTQGQKTLHVFGEIDQIISENRPKNEINFDKRQSDWRQLAFHTHKVKFSQWRWNHRVHNITANWNLVIIYGILQLQRPGKLFRWKGVLCHVYFLPTCDLRVKSICPWNLDRQYTHKCWKLTAIIFKYRHSIEVIIAILRFHCEYSASNAIPPLWNLYSHSFVYDHIRISSNALRKQELCRELIEERSTFLLASKWCRIEILQ